MIEVMAKQPDLAALECDDFVIGIYADQTLAGDLAALDQSLDGGLGKLFEQGELSGERKRVTVVHTFGKIAAKRLVFVGLGEPESLSFAGIREAAARAVKAVCDRGEGKTVAVYVEDRGAVSAERLAHAVTEAFCLASYRYHGYRQQPESNSPIHKVCLLVEPESLPLAAQGVRTGEALSAGTNLARDLTNMPGNYLTPGTLKDAIVEVAERYGMPYEVMDLAKLKVLGMGGVLAVAQGSAEPAYVVTVKYQGRETWDDVIGLVGKGVTFDTGGISIKPVAGMEEMKSDMGGAAAMIGALEAIGRLQPKVNVMLVVGCVENMPSGTAYKPGDVITTMSGKTVEIITTDAEGRLVLADCITYARQEGVSCLIDCATLTGGVVVALGTVCSGAMGNDQQLVGEVLASAERAGERLWQLPTFEEYHELNKSRVADLKNSGGRYGHAIIGAVFLQKFAEDTPWVHLDNAGTAYLTTETDLAPAGATGSMARTVAQFVLNRSKS
ncbi:leucyl aminopeptidase [Brevibacillus sp. B_LB10_24]|uniref:leucyl aminopeptidase n=1 Tax=Brevibacillus sp. B_LB10_24 TaxID=3380645 RepID=UPI0038B88B21